MPKRIQMFEIEKTKYKLGAYVSNCDLSKQLGEEETKKICVELISKLGVNSVKDMGKVIGELKKLHSDEIDFAKAGPLIKELLNN